MDSFIYTYNQYVRGVEPCNNITSEYARIKNFHNRSVF